VNLPVALAGSIVTTAFRSLPQLNSSRSSVPSLRLSASSGGPTASIRAHGTFWRGVTRDQFVAEVVFEHPLIVVGQGGDSNLVKALKGIEPFDGSEFRRMPAGRPPVPADQIAFIERWIDDGCPEDLLPSEPALTWRATNAPMADQLRGKRYDDVWFVTPDLGWGVNSDGKILRTTDGGASWDQQFHDQRIYFRCLGFASETRGWAGTLSGPARLLETRDGATWNAVTNLPEDAPKMICGLTVVNESVVYASGTNYPFPFSERGQLCPWCCDWTRDPADRRREAGLYLRAGEWGIPA
jgi:hypothetical protein